MVVPLIVGAAQVATTKAAQTRTGRRTRAATQRPELLRQVRARRQREAREQTPLTAEQKRSQTARTRAMLRGRKGLRGKMLTGNMTGRGGSTMELAKAGSAGLFILLSTSIFIVVQCILFALCIFGFVVESTWFVGWLLPGETLFMLSFMLMCFISLCLLVYAVAIFTLRGVRCFEDKNDLIFFICLALCIMPFINFIPWFLVFTAAVIWSKSDIPRTNNERSPQLQTSPAYS